MEKYFMKSVDALVDTLKYSKETFYYQVAGQEYTVDSVALLNMPLGALLKLMNDNNLYFKG